MTSRISTLRHPGRLFTSSPMAPGTMYVLFQFERRVGEHRLIGSVQFVAMVGEFVGTFLFLFFALSGTQVANNEKTSADLTVKQTGGANPQQLMYIALCFGFSLAVNAWVFYRISGGLFNPAVTLGMVLIGALPWLRGLLLFITEIIAAICSAAVVRVLFPGPLNCQTTLTPGTNTAQGFFIEMFLTTQLIITIFMLAAEKHKGTFIAPVGMSTAFSLCGECLF
jgi:aquaporin rerated protein, other eukaryote